MKFRTRHILALGGLFLVSLVAGIIRYVGLSAEEVLGLFLVVAGATLILEGISWVALRKVYPNFSTRGEFPFISHIFTHYVPNPEFPDITSEGFRKTSSGNRSAVRGKKIYLGGDCTLFEKHLPIEETLAFQIQSAFPENEIINAGCMHYSSMHVLNRFINDLARGVRPDVFVFFISVNDTISFLHQKDGKIQADHSHYYIPWISDRTAYRLVYRLPSFTLKFLSLYGAYGKSRSNWDRLIEDYTDYSADRVRHGEATRKLFLPQGPQALRRTIEMADALCKGLGIKLIPATFQYNSSDMNREPRATLAWCMDLLNEELREASKKLGLPLIDLAAQTRLGPEDIANKWHYRRSGNEKRLQVLAPILKESISR